VAIEAARDGYSIHLVVGLVGRHSTFPPAAFKEAELTVAGESFLTDGAIIEFGDPAGTDGVLTADSLTPRTGSAVAADVRVAWSCVHKKSRGDAGAERANGAALATWRGRIGRRGLSYGLLMSAGYGKSHVQD
jgi:hypothetical protein